MLKTVQWSRDSQVARSLQAIRWCTRVKHAKKLNLHASYSTTGQKVQTSHSVSSRLELSTQSSHKAKSPVHSVMEKLTIRILFSLQYKYLLYPRNIESFQREFWERNPREKQNWLIHNLYIVTLQIPQLSPSPLLHPWEIHWPKPFLTIPISMRRLFGTWETIRKGPIHIGWCYGL